MISYYKENIQLYLVFSFWLLTGVFGGPLIYAVLPVTLLLMKQKGMYEEIFIGYLFILILSDNSAENLFFAKNVKNIYITFIAFFFFFDSKSFSPVNGLYRIFIPFFLFSIITMMFALGDSYFLTSVQKTLSYFLMFLILPTYIHKLYGESGADFLKRFILFSLTVLIVGVFLKYFFYDFTHVASRFRGVFGGPNGLGIYCVLFFIILSVTKVIYPSLFTKKQYIALLLFILISLYWTGSRNALISVILFYLFYRFFGNYIFLGIVVSIFISLLIEIISVNIVSIVHFLGLETLLRVQTLEEGSGRYVAWGFAWEQIQENFFIGRGFAYNEFYMRQHYKTLSKLGHQGGIHNSFLTFWMDQGLVGLIIYLRSYILLFIRASKKTKFAFPAMFAISFTAFFESWLVGSLSAFAFFGIFIFTILSSNEIIPKEVENKEDARLII